uniref:Interferon-induced protein 44-like n=1 Tax=Labrus bergylta TaxID=56723 RepID=A0A3Q3F682_9LABR
SVCKDTFFLFIISCANSDEPAHLKKTVTKDLNGHSSEIRGLTRNRQKNKSESKKPYPIKKQDQPAHLQSHSRTSRASQEKIWDNHLPNQSHVNPHPHPHPPRPSTPPPSPLFSEPWRTLPTSTQDNLNFLKSYQPRKKGVKHLRILLHGPVGAGKSSFINSVDSVLRGIVTSRAETDANTGSSFTLKYQTYKIQKDDQSFYSIVFNDIMGLEANLNNGVQVEDIKLALRGHVREGYKFKPNGSLTKNDPGYKSYPSLDDKVHVLVCVVPVDSISLLDDKVVQKLREVRLAASDLGIPQLAILTKVDRACPEVESNIHNLHKSKYLKGQVEQFSAMLGIPIKSIFLVKNYESEINTYDDINGPILTALRQMVTFGEDYLVTCVHSVDNSKLILLIFLSFLVLLFSYLILL